MFHFLCINKKHFFNFVSLVFRQLKGKECKMTEEIRIEFVSDTVVGVEGMNGLSEKISETLVTNLCSLMKLKAEFDWSEKGSSWEEDDLFKIVLANHEALMKQNTLLQAEFADLTCNLFKLACEIDPLFKQNKPLQAVFVGLTSDLSKLALGIDANPKPDA